MFAIGLLLLVVAGVISLVGTVMFVVAAFRVSVLWGVLVLFVPFAGIVFLVKYWQEAKRAFLVGLAGTAVGILGWFTFSTAIAARMKSEFGDIAAQMQAQMERQHSVAKPREPSGVADPAPVEPALAVPENPEPPAGAEAVAAAAAALPKGDYEETFGEIRLSDIGKHVGEDLVFVEEGGNSVRGTLVAVDSRALRIERGMPGGSIQYSIPREELREVHAAE